MVLNRKLTEFRLFKKFDADDNIWNNNRSKLETENIQKSVEFMNLVFEFTILSEKKKIYTVIIEQCFRDHVTDVYHQILLDY